MVFLTITLNPFRAEVRLLWEASCRAITKIEQLVSEVLEEIKSLLDFLYVFLLELKFTIYRDKPKLENPDK